MPTWATVPIKGEVLPLILACLFCLFANPCAPRKVLSWCHDIISSYHHIIISLYHHIIISSYHYMVISSYHHINRSSSSKSVSQFWAKSQQQKSKIVFEPPHQGTERLDLLGKWGHFSWRICCLRSKIRSSSKTTDFWFDASFLVRNFHQKSFWASKNQMSGIVWNAFWQSFAPIGVILEG